MRRTQLYVLPEQARKLEHLSEEMGLTVSEHYRRALEAYFVLPHIRDRLRRMPKQLDLFEDNDAED